jgi:uncharacterized membrane protein YphA (DoxX/SURF4 family)
MKPEEHELSEKDNEILAEAITRSWENEGFKNALLAQVLVPLAMLGAGGVGLDAIAEKAHSLTAGI